MQVANLACSMQEVSAFKVESYAHTMLLLTAKELVPFVRV